MSWPIRLKSDLKAWDGVVDKMALTWRSNGLSKDKKEEVFALRRLVSWEVASSFIGCCVSWIINFRTLMYRL